jgi:dUTP pyrophosphatase
MENNNLEDLKKEIDNLQKLFEDGIEELVVKNVIDKHGFDISELEKEMTQSNNKLNINYSLSSVDSVIPTYVYPTDSGFDLYSTEDVIIGEFGRDLISTGLHIDIPDGYEIQVRSKSGLAIKQGLMVLNSPGTVDQGYTGEIKVIIFNTNPYPVTITKGQKIGQAVLSSVVCGKWINFNKVDSIEDKDRSDKGFGSTGLGL